MKNLIDKLKSLSPYVLALVLFGVFAFGVTFHSCGRGQYDTTAWMLAIAGVVYASVLYGPVLYRKVKGFLLRGLGKD